MTEKETSLISPDEIEKRRAERKPRTQVLKDHSIEEEEVIVETPTEGEKFINTAGLVKINFETLGRFDIPRTLHFDDYSGKHVVDITMSNEENFVETLLTIMQELIQEENVNIGDMLPQEFIEAMIGMKIKFNTPMHEHRWLCDCQMDEDNKQPQTSNIDLQKLNYLCILESDETLKEFYKPYFETCTDEQFLDYLEKKYGDEEEVINVQDYDRDVELGKVKIEEPISQTVGEDIFKFRFTRMKDIITAQKIIDDKYAVAIKKIEMQKPHGVKKTELEISKEKEMRKVQTDKMKDLIHIVKALTLVNYNGEDITDNNQKIELYSKVKRKEIMEFNDLLQHINFGIQDERDFECEFCGKLDRRLLQREFDPYEFIPLDSGSDSKLRKCTGGSILFGV